MRGARGNALFPAGAPQAPLESTPAGKQPNEKSDASGNANRLPGVVMHVVIGITQRLARAAREILLSLGQPIAHYADGLFGACPDLLNTVTRLARRCAQERFGILKH